MRRYLFYIDKFCNIYIFLYLLLYIFVICYFLCILSEHICLYNRFILQLNKSIKKLLSRPVQNTVILLLNRHTV